MKDYNGVSGKDRLKNWDLTKKAMKEGIIPYPSPTKNLIQICQGYYMTWHNRNRYSNSFCKFILEDNRFEKINEDIRESLRKDGFVWIDIQLTHHKNND